MKKSLKLSIELVPKTSWCKNVRSLAYTDQWDEIRKDTYELFNYTCAICGASRNQIRLDCHEMWVYDDKKHIQILGCFLPLCTTCHAVKHIGRSGIIASQGNLDMNYLIHHFTKINNCNLKTYNNYLKSVIETWRERSQHEWSTDLREYEYLRRQHGTKNKSNQ